MEAGVQGVLGVGREGGTGDSADPAHAGIKVGWIGPDSPTRDFQPLALTNSLPGLARPAPREGPSKGDLRR